MRMDKNSVWSALTALADHLEQRLDSQIDIVVCGGSALEALDLVDRTTMDVDILAIMGREEEDSPTLLSADPLPAVVVDAAGIVARDFGLPENWLNPGPTELLSQGLPEGFIERLHSQRFGPKLVVHFIDRFDQICLKMYAAINGGGPHHLADLRALGPSRAELLSAARWCLTQDASEVFPYLVRSFLEKVGYGDVVEELE